MPVNLHRGLAHWRAGPEVSVIRRTVLPGGLRVVTEFVPSVRSASVGVWVNVGSRDEGPTVAGAAHFLEHLLFKATPTRTAVEIAQAVDAVGGELNAFTAKEHTCYYAHVLDDDLELAVDLVSDVVLRGSCESHDVEPNATWCSRRSPCATTIPRTPSVTCSSRPCSATIRSGAR